MNYPSDDSWWVEKDCPLCGQKTRIHTGWKMCAECFHVLIWPKLKHDLLTEEKLPEKVPEKEDG